jgi:hypothetical protein
MVDSKAEVGDE